MHNIEKQLPIFLNKIQYWTDENGFKFSKIKTVCMHFCQQRKHHPEPLLHLNNELIQIVKETKFHGIIFDSKLTFVPHIKYLKAKWLKAPNLLRIAAHTDWGADYTALMLIYTSCIISKLDYGSVVYGSWRKSYLQVLGPIHNQTLRLCFGAYRTSLCQSLYAEINELSLSLQRSKLSMNYTLKRKSNPNNPTYISVFIQQFEEKFASKPKAIPPSGLCMQQLFSFTGIELKHVITHSISITPSWKYNVPLVLFDININNKSSTSL